MAQREDFARRRSPRELIRALGHLTREDSDSVASAVLPLLEHPEPDVRSEALSAVFVLWRLGEHRERAEKMLQCDRHAVVRARAAFALAAISNDQLRGHDAQRLLKKVEDGNEDSEVRRAAYEALMLLYGRGDFPDATLDFIADEHIDWEWIREIRSSLN